jgi:hypothetical protein
MAQTKVGWRPYVATPQQITTSTLLTSIYGVWNADKLGTSLDTSIRVAYNGDNVNDTSGNAQNGTNVNGVTFTTGKVGNAFTFNGSNYVTLPNNSMKLTGDFSVSCWVNIATHGTFQTILSGYYTTAGVDYGFILRIENNGGFKFRLFSGAAQIDTNPSGGAISTNTWYHVTVTKTSSQVKWYINGVANNVFNGTYNIPYHSTINNGSIGALYKWNGIDTVHFMSNNSKIDALSVWNKELTANEVASLYNTGTGAEYPFSSQTLPSPNDAVSANHGTLMNGATFTDGKIGKAFTFDGINDVVTLPTNTMKFTNNFTISLWFNVSDGGNSWGTLFSTYHNDGSGDYGYFLHKTGSNLLWQIYSSGNNNNKTVAIPSYSTGTWFNVVVTANNTVENGFSNAIYINGSLVGYNTYMENIRYHPTINHYPSIGAMYYGSSPTISNPFNGKIDAVNIWDRKLTSTEITELYNAGTGKQYPYVVGAPSSLLTNLYAIYKGENNANDLLGNYNGTAVGGLTYTAGKSGNAFNFNGTNAYVQLPNNSMNFTGDFSISLWVYFTSLNTEQALFSNYYELAPNTGSSRGYMMYIDGQTFYWFICGTSQVGLTSNISTFLNTWKMITVTFKSGIGSKVFFDNIQVNANSSSVTPLYNTTHSLTIGCYKYNNILVQGLVKNGGKIDEVNVWTKELTATDVTTLYNSGAGKFYPTF